MTITAKYPSNNPSAIAAPMATLAKYPLVLFQDSGAFGTLVAGALEVVVAVVVTTSDRLSKVLEVSAMLCSNSAVGPVMKLSLV